MNDDWFWSVCEQSIESLLVKKWEYDFSCNDKWSWMLSHWLIRIVNVLKEEIWSIILIWFFKRLIILICVLIWFCKRLLISSSDKRIFLIDTERQSILAVSYFLKKYFQQSLDLMHYHFHILWAWYVEFILTESLQKMLTCIIINILKTKLINFLWAKTHLLSHSY